MPNMMIFDPTDTSSNPEVWTAAVGEHRLGSVEKFEQIKEIERIILHPKFFVGDMYANYDIDDGSGGSDGDDNEDDDSGNNGHDNEDDGSADRDVDYNEDDGDGDVDDNEDDGSADRDVDYNEDDGDGDVDDNEDDALVKLKTPAVLDKNVYPICLLRKGMKFPWGMECYVTGWGITQFNETQPDALREAKVRLVSREVCNKNISYGGLVHDTALYAGFEEGGVDACQGLSA
ncbi:hypothetical protein QZH41_002542 [Actinostola sp. cb2023]|nr:hypothetical protein QZH41_002542 [Actinostola sp. cb2023]